MLAERVGTDACRLAGRWKIDIGLAADLIDLDQWASAQIQKAFPPWFPSRAWPGLFIISGQRSSDQNRRAGGARDSRHLGCPATAADLRIGRMAGVHDEEIWAMLGGKWKLMGNRWGGDFKWEGSPRPNPNERNHFDLGHFVIAAAAVPLAAVPTVVRVPEVPLAAVPTVVRVPEVYPAPRRALRELRPVPRKYGEYEQIGE